MRCAACLLALATACGGPDESGRDAAPADAAWPDGPPDPFAGMYDDPSDFPHTNCTPGSIAGIAHAEMWPDLAMRTKVVGGALETYVAQYYDEVLVPHVITADDLFVRHSYYRGRWFMRAVDVCGVDSDGTLHGAMALCEERPPDWPGDPCSVFPFDAPPFRWIAGEGEGEHLTLVGELGAAWPGTSTEVRVDGDVAFLSRFDDGVRIVSIANPAAPVEVGHLALPIDWANDIEVVRGQDGRRYVVTASTTANVIDVTNPAAPELVAQLPFAPHSVFVEGTTAYLVDGGTPAIEVWNLAQPRSPVRLGAWSYPGSVGWHDIYVTGGIAYLSDSNGSGLHVVDLRAPQAPVVLGAEDAAGSQLWHSPWRTTIGGRLVAIDGTEASQSIGLRLLDGDPASSSFLDPLGEWTLGVGSAHNLMAIGDRIYVAHYWHGVRVLDASTPSSPRQIAYFNTWPVGEGGAGDHGTLGIALDPVRRRIYLADSVRGLIILQGDATVFPTTPTTTRVRRADAVAPRPARTGSRGPRRSRRSR